MSYYRIWSRNPLRRIQVTDDRSLVQHYLNSTNHFVTTMDFDGRFVPGSEEWKQAVGAVPQPSAMHALEAAQVDDVHAAYRRARFRDLMTETPTAPPTVADEGKQQDDQPSDD